MISVLRNVCIPDHLRGIVYLISKSCHVYQFSQVGRDQHQVIFIADICIIFTTSHKTKPDSNISLSYF
jgi:hypothetical protein